MVAIGVAKVVFVVVVVHECVVLVVWGEKKMLPRDEVARCLSEILRRSRHSQSWRRLKVVRVCGVLNWECLV